MQRQKWSNKRGVPQPGEAREEKEIETVVYGTPEIGRYQVMSEVTYRVDAINTCDVYERHEHHLFNATRYQLPAKQVKQPKFVMQFFQKIPAWLQPHMFVVEGDMLRETVEEHVQVVSTKNVRKEQSRKVIHQGFLYSPAVTLGSFVLTGWSGSDR